MKATSVTQKIWRCAIAAVLAFGLAFSSAALQAKPALAEGNAKVQADTNGVLYLTWSLHEQEYYSGSCFLINEDTVITAYHCIQFTEEDLKGMGFSSSYAENFSSEVKYKVHVMGDVTINATFLNGSKEQDYAILKLDQKINDKSVLTFTNSTNVKATDAVYALGFPGNSQIEAQQTFTEDQVTISAGTVTKAETLCGADNSLSYELSVGGYYFGYNIKGYFIQTNVGINHGDSGGPLVDANGRVIGVNSYTLEGRDYHAASDVIMKTLKSLGITYTSDDDPTPTTSSGKETLDLSALKSAISKAEALDSSKYTKETYAAVTSALTEAKTTVATELDSKASASDVAKLQAEADAAAKALNDAIDALQEPTGPNIGLIVGIVIAVIVVVVIVVVLVMRSKKKKDEGAAPQTNEYQPQAPAPVQPAQPQYAAPQPLPYGDETEAATTVLDEGGADTVILFQAASGGSLTRMSNNEHIPINKAEFTIGRERSKVDYCLEGNGSISRIHVRLSVRDGNTFLIDNKAANGTYVNGVKLRAGEEVQLNAGDIVTLADEKFKYQN